MAALLAGFATSRALAATHYVNGGNATPSAPFSTWATAAVRIQDAVDASDAGDEVVVTNGVYASGGRVNSYFRLTNRVAVVKPLVVRSVNGPQVTVIQGSQVSGVTNGDAAIRCVYLTNGAQLSGFTLTNGATRSVGDPNDELSGGGVFCIGASVSNCVITGNAAYYYAGGAAYGTLDNCVLIGNSSSQGGGTAYSTVNNCVYRGNRAGDGGGAFGGALRGCVLTENFATYWASAAFQASLNNCTLTANQVQSDSGAVDWCTLYNCISYFNAGGRGNFANNSTFYNCCTTPLPPGGSGNITVDPQLASASHLSEGSPCRAAGSTPNAAGVDIDGEAWGAPPSIGCDEYHLGAVTGPLTAALASSATNVLTDDLVQFSASIEGRTTASAWDFADGMAVSNQPFVMHSWSTPGDYSVVLRAYNESLPLGVSTNLTIHVMARPVFYVATTSTNPVPPYTSWSTAATNIQDAVDAASGLGALVLVSNGVYSAGGRAVFGTMTNRVAVYKSVRVQSVNGPQATIIQGRQVPGVTNGDGAIRCVYLTNGASLIGFTLTNGATRSSGDITQVRGGGVACDASGSTVSNCVIVGNAAADAGGGAHWGALNNCVLLGNSATYGAAAAYNTLSNCILGANVAASNGGGAIGATLSNCRLTNNLAGNNGGGAADSPLNNCLVSGNSASTGGGLYFYYGSSLCCMVNNCTVAGNTALQGGGIYNYTNATVNNSIVYFNSAQTGSNYFTPTIMFFYYSCTAPMPLGGGVTTNDPLFVSLATGDFHLQPHSPCVDTGHNQYAPPGPDLDGNARIVGSTVDIGAYEYQLLIPPYITSEPADQTITAGLDANFSVTAAGSAPLLYQWRRNGANIAGATGSVLTLSHVQVSDAGSYSVVVSNAAPPPVTSRSATLTVNPSVTHYANAAGANPIAPYTNWATAAQTIQAAVDVAVAGDEIVVTNGIYATGGRAVFGSMTNRVAVDKALRVRSVNGPLLTIIQGRQVPGTTNGNGAIRCVYLTNGASLSGFTLTNGATLSTGDTVYELSGGGVLAVSATVSNCVMTGNAATVYGGGADGPYSGALYNCLVISNTACYGGGAVADMYNCTLTGNSASAYGGGSWGGRLKNCIIYFNKSPNDSNCSGGGFDFCCTVPLPGSGSGNVAGDPLFINLAAGNFHLQSTSPCINAGNNSYVGTSTDLDGNPRIINGSVDIGAYEFQGTSGTNGFHAWLALYGLPTDGSVDFTDTDGDGMNNWQEWRSGTNPTNTASVLRFIFASTSTAPTGAVALSWQSVLGISYFLQRATNLATPTLFSTVVTNLPGQSGTTSYTDTTGPSAAPRFYRVGVGQ